MFCSRLKERIVTGDLAERAPRSFAFGPFVLIPERQLLLKGEAPVFGGLAPWRQLMTLTGLPGHLWPVTAGGGCCSRAFGVAKRGDRIGGWWRRIGLGRRTLGHAVARRAAVGLLRPGGGGSRCGLLRRDRPPDRYGPGHMGVRFDRRVCHRPYRDAGMGAERDARDDGRGIG